MRVGAGAAGPGLVCAEGLRYLYETVPDALRHAFFDSPVGPLTMVSGRAGLVSLSFGFVEPRGSQPDRDAHAHLLSLLDQYFSGKPTLFDIPLDPVGTDFERRVWEALCRIPWGETRTYGEIAAGIGRPSAARAVGRANHRNPIAIVIPCHRVVGADGSLTGYAAGLRVKSRLLDIEGRSSDARHLFASTEPTATSHSRGRATTVPAAL